MLCNMGDLSSLTRDRTRVPCIARRILNHWTTREVPICLFLLLFPLFYEMDQKILLQFMLKSAQPIFSSRSFTVSGLIFKPLIHFEFIFVYGVRECSNFILLQVAVWFSQHLLLKRLSVLRCIFLSPLFRLINCVCGFISGLYSVPLIYVSVFMIVPYCFDNCSFVV